MRKRMSYNDFPVKMNINNDNEIDEYNDYLEDKESLNNMQKRLTILYNEKKSNQILTNLNADRKTSHDLLKSNRVSDNLSKSMLTIKEEDYNENNHISLNENLLINNTNSETSLGKEKFKITDLEDDAYYKEAMNIVFDTLSNSRRLATLKKRVYISSLLLILLASSSLVLWLIFEFHNLNHGDTYATFMTDGFLIIIHLFGIIFLYCMFKNTTKSLQLKIKIVLILNGILLIYKIIDLMRFLFFSYFTYFVGKILLIKRYQKNIEVKQDY